MMCEFGVPSKEQDYPWHRLVMVVFERMDKRYPKLKRVSRPKYVSYRATHPLRHPAIFTPRNQWNLRSLQSRIRAIILMYVRRYALVYSSSCLCGSCDDAAPVLDVLSADAVSDGVSDVPAPVPVDDALELALDFLVGFGARLR